PLFFSTTGSLMLASTVACVWNGCCVKWAAITGGVFTGAGGTFGGVFAGLGGMLGGAVGLLAGGRGVFAPRGVLPFWGGLTGGGGGWAPSPRSPTSGPDPSSRSDPVTIPTDAGVNATLATQTPPAGTTPFAQSPR